jgi:cytochrome b6-f complex iron-sulfur subunit
MSGENTFNQEGITRREFLHYIWLSSLGAFAIGSAGATIAYSYPRFKAGEFGGKFVLGQVEDFAEGSVTEIREGKFFLVRQGDQFKALYQVCTHLGCLVRYTGESFSCPCHGSQFAEDGTLVTSPASRDLDEFAVEIVDGDVVVDTGTRTKGQSRTV